MDNKYLTSIFEAGDTNDPLDEIISLSTEICPSADHLLIREIHKDLTNFFNGSHPFFKKNTLKYHDLRHSRMVVLATIRLFHGLHCNHIHISENVLIKGLLSAYFHDTGMLLLKEDTVESDAEYIANHEERSILFLKRYATLKNLTQTISADCDTIINYTNISLDPAVFALHSREVQLAGRVVGSADILAQMADRYYLEALPLLYRELKASGTHQYTSVLDLMEQTAKFYHTFVLKRLMITFSNVTHSMQIHFRERHMIDRNLYIENINSNIQYLTQIINKCETKFSCIETFLKRKPPVI